MMLITKYILDNGRIIYPMEWVYVFMLMIQFMLVLGLMESQMEKEFFFLEIIKLYQVFGLVVRLQVTEYTLGNTTLDNK